jgi:hypothetical protein
LQFLSNAQIEKVLAKYRKTRSTEIAERLLEELAKLGDPDQDNISFTVIKVNDASVRPKESVRAFDSSATAAATVVEPCGAPSEPLPCRFWAPSQGVTASVRAVQEQPCSWGRGFVGSKVAAKASHRHKVSTWQNRTENDSRPAAAAHLTGALPQAAGGGWDA